MRTSTKLLLLFAALVLLFIGWFFHARYIEEQQLMLVINSNINSRNTSFDRVLKLEAAPFETFVFDYSRDDALIGFLQHSGGASFPGDAEKLLRSFNLSGIWLLRADLSQAFSACTPAAAGLGALPLPADELRRLLSQRYFHHFFTATPKGLLELRCAPVQPGADTDRKAAPEGFLIAGRFWDQLYIEMLGGLTESTISMKSILPDTVIPPTSYDFGDGTISFSRVLRAWDDRPLVRMSITSAVPVFREIMSASNSKLMQFLAFFAAVLVLVYIALLTWVGLPLRRLSQSLEKADPAPIGPLTRANSEFGRFARLIVSSFSQQQALTEEIAERARAEEQLREANRLLKTRDQELNASNLQLMAANQQMQANYQQLKRSELLLRENEACLGLALDIAQETVWEMDLAAGTVSIVKIADPSISATSYLLDDLCGHWHLCDPIAEPGSRERMQRALDDHVKGKTERFVFEGRLQRKTGEWCWLYSMGRASEFDQEGKPLKILGTSIDITQIKQAQEELNLLATALEQAWECVVITDRNANILYANPAFERISGYSITEVLGKNPRMLQSGKNSLDFYADLWGTLSRGQVWRGHFINKRKDGSLFEEDCTITPLSDTSGEIQNFVAVKRDVTENTRLERQLRQSQKMEAIGTLAGGIAHDFNNILTAINGYTELCLRPGIDQNRLRSNLQQVLRAGIRARELVAQILAFSRQTEQEMKPVSITPIIKEALRFLRASLPTSVEIRQSIEPSSDVVIADPTQLHQVLMNLCANAGYSMREHGGVLEVGLGRVKLGPEACLLHAGLKPGVYMRMTVRDSGQGMPQEVLEHIFEPYFTTKGKGEGTGLGLAVVHGIVQNHGGAISVHSEQGRGSVFEVLLPAVAADQDAAEVEMQAAVGGSESILVVDDEEVLTQMAVSILEPLGYSVHTARLPEEALALFRTTPHTFDLIITDKVMPHMTGFVLADNIMRIRPDVPIILCTGFAEKTDAEKARRAGIRKVINKPYTLPEIASSVREVLDRA